MNFNYITFDCSLTDVCYYYYYYYFIMYTQLINVLKKRRRRCCCIEPPLPYPTKNSFKSTDIPHLWYQTLHDGGEILQADQGCRKPLTEKQLSPPVDARAINISSEQHHEGENKFIAAAPSELVYMVKSPSPSGIKVKFCLIFWNCKIFISAGSIIPGT